ncbi:hypothetical protein NQ318_014451, partial [Aromia moschata]
GLKPAYTSSIDDPDSDTSLPSTRCHFSTYFRPGLSIDTYGNCNVETIDQRDVVEIESAGSLKGNFGEGRRGSASVALAFQPVSAVAGQAVVVAGVAPGSGPESTCPILGGCYGQKRSINIQCVSKVPGRQGNRRSIEASKERRSELRKARSTQSELYEKQEESTIEELAARTRSSIFNVTRNFMDTIGKHVLNFKNISLSNFSVANSISYEALKGDHNSVVHHVHAKGDDVFLGFAGERVVVVVSVTVCIVTVRLEIRRVVHGPFRDYARVRSSIFTAATILVSVESDTGGLASYHPVFRVEFQGVRTLLIEVIRAGGLLATVVTAVATSIYRFELKHKSNPKSTLTYSGLWREVEAIVGSI